jgi:transglutaminase-like putative cysteine protease
VRVRIEHLTTFTYAEPAHSSFNEVRLTPRNDERQNLLDFSLQITPSTRPTSYRDHFGTTVHAFNIWAPHTQLAILGVSTVVTSPPRVPPNDTGALDALEDPLFRDTEAEWLHASPLASGGDHLDAFAHHVRRVVRPTSVVELVLGVSHEVHGRFKYRPGTSYVSSTVDDLLERGTGVCQDFAHLAIATLRDLGVPARYVSGYFYAGPVATIQTDVALAVESHAWVEAFVPGLGWLAVDPTNDCLADERHVVVAVGRDYSDVSPVRGVVSGGGGSRLDVSVTMVAPSAETIRRPVAPTVVGPAGAVTGGRAHPARRTTPGGANGNVRGGALAASLAQGPATLSQAQQQQQQQQRQQ